MGSLLNNNFISPKIKLDINPRDVNTDIIECNMYILYSKLL